MARRTVMKWIAFQITSGFEEMEITLCFLDVVQTSNTLAASLSHQVDFFANSLNLLKSITKISHFAFTPEAKHNSALHGVTDDWA